MKARANCVDDDENNCAMGNCPFKNPKKMFHWFLYRMAVLEKIKRMMTINNESDGVVFFLSVADNCKTSWPLSLLTTFNIQLFGLDRQDRSRENSKVFFLGSKPTNKKKFTISRGFTFSFTIKSPNLIYCRTYFLFFVSKCFPGNNKKQQQTKKKLFQISMKSKFYQTALCLLVKHLSAFEQGSHLETGWLSITSIWNVYIFPSNTGQEIFALLLLFLPC